MKKRILIATVVGAVIAFVWGFVSWSFLSWHTPKSFENSAEVAEVISRNTDGHGMYMLPPHGKDGQPDVDAIKKGPFMYAIVRPGELNDWSMFKPMILSFAVNLFLAFLIATIMIRRSHYRSKLLVGAAFGLFAGITAALPLAIWMELPSMEMTARLCDPIISWTLAAAVMGLIVIKPKRRIFT
ncbi:MAG: hypothetical protein AB8F34_13255 [Akkermansiaceae bacterium]